LVALAAVASGTTTITGANRLTHKESNRAQTLQEEFGKMGIWIVLQGDTMLVHGGRPMNGASVHSRQDHRIAMAEAVAALRAEGPVVIEDAQAIGKSYPAFFEDLQGLGAKLAYHRKGVDEHAG
jgi:3-phosphoshikimate 1-carboxyvinyltransferase